MNWKRQKLVASAPRPSASTTRRACSTSSSPQKIRTCGGLLVELRSYLLGFADLLLLLLLP
jgi:hypothetical protein